MKYIKRSERMIKASAISTGIKGAGGIVTEVAEYSKWHELQNGGRIQIKMFIMKADATKVNGNICYYLKDGMNMLASDMTLDINEIKSWLVCNGYKTVHDWYVQDCGMSEETWREWNTGND